MDPRKARQISVMVGMGTQVEPPSGTVEAWAWHFIHTTDLGEKRFPPRPPKLWEQSPGARRVEAPGRPKELQVIPRSPRTPKPGAFVRDEVRAQLFHTFWHHELQAAELFAWAILAFPDTPIDFRAGLLGICLEEIGHMELYAKYIQDLGFDLGAFPVRDWFWQRVPMAQTPAQFVAMVSLGLEAGNLDHGALFGPRLLAVGDEVGARIIDKVSKDEEGHVAFGTKWFPLLTGAEDLEFEAWRGALPEPLSPILFRGKPLDRDARKRAGQGDAFLDALGTWQP